MPKLEVRPTNDAQRPARADTHPPVRRGRRRDIVIVAVGLAAGLGIAGVFGGIDLPSRDERQPSPLAAAGPLTAVTAAPSGSVPSGDPAPDPSAAVEAFLDAEIAGDLDRSYRLLAAAQRASHGSAAAWIAAHADLLPVTGYELGGVAAGEGVAEVAAELTLDSSIDEVVGLVPARASVVWVVVAEDGGWLVDHEASRFIGRYPDDTLVLEAAEAWLRDRSSCRRAQEYDAGLVGASGAAADSLCGATPRPRLARAVGRLDASDGAAFVSAFGPSALDWARTVELVGSPELRIVLAPVEDEWLVIGAVPTR